MAFYAIGSLYFVFLISGVFLCSPELAFGSTQAEHANQLIEVEYEPDLDLAYADRRGPRSILFSIRYEDYKPEDYFSQIDTSSYASNYGEKAMPLVGFSLAWKRNFSALSIGVDPSIAFGRVDGKDGLGFSRSLSLTRYGLGLSVFLDTLTKEPWIVPYGEVQPFVFSWTEEADTGSKSGTSDVTFAYRAGLLIQLNKLDECAARSALANYGLENTFLDIFIHQHMTSESSSDVDLQSALSYGAGVKLEF